VAHSPPSQFEFSSSLSGVLIHSTFAWVLKDAEKTVRSVRKREHRLNLGQIPCLGKYTCKDTNHKSMQIIPKSGLPSEDGSSSTVSEPVLELFATSALPLEELVLIVPALGVDKTFAKSTLLVNPTPPSRTLTCGRDAGATPVAMAVSKQQEPHLGDPTNTCKATKTSGDCGEVSNGC